MPREKLEWVEVDDIRDWNNRSGRFGVLIEENFEGRLDLYAMEDGSLALVNAGSPVDRPFISIFNLGVYEQ